MLAWTAANAQQPAAVMDPAAANHAAGDYSYTPSERLDNYLTRTLGPETLLRAAAMAGFDQARDHPEGWEQGFSGYARRLGSRQARAAVANTIQLGVEAALREDSRYTASEQTGLLPRLQDSLAHSFAIRTPGGRRAPPVGRLAASFGAGFISRTWYPEGDNAWEDGLRSGALSFGIYAGTNVFREFWPDIKRLFGK